jgi:hypothetical protein
MTLAMGERAQAGGTGERWRPIIPAEWMSDGCKNGQVIAT